MQDSNTCEMRKSQTPSARNCRGLQDTRTTYEMRNNEGSDPIPKAES
jgi:hypothetical protein